MPRKALCAAAFFTLAFNLAAQQSAPPTRHFDGQSWWAHVKFLADDNLEGRETGSEGLRKAESYVVDQFSKAGLQPAGTNGFYQQVKFISRQIVEKDSSAALVVSSKAQPLTLGDDAYFSTRADLSSEEITAQLVFVGYGLKIPEKNYDDLSGLDLHGKIVVYLAGSPSDIPTALSSHYQTIGERWKSLKQAGAIGIITIPNPASMDIPWSRMSLNRAHPSMDLADLEFNETQGLKMAMTFNPAQAEKLFAGSGHTFEAMCAEMTTYSFFNAASLPGSLPMILADSTGAVFTLARALREMPSGKWGSGLRRSILFVVVTAEEKGLLGSKYFAAHPTVPPKSMIADINIDMFLPIVPLKVLKVPGLAESDLGDRARDAAQLFGVRVQPDPEPLRNVFIRSDQYNFIRHGVPALKLDVGFDPGSPEQKTFKDWLTNRYHAPSDDLAQPVDLASAGLYEDVVRQLLISIDNADARPQWKPDSFFRRYATEAGN
jgi:hypothetical protein